MLTPSLAHFRQIGVWILCAAVAAACGPAAPTFSADGRPDGVPSAEESGWLIAGAALIIAGGLSAGYWLGVRMSQARRRRLEDETRNRLAQLAALQETNRALVSTLELNVLLEMIIRQAATLLKADSGILNLADWDKMEDEVVAWVGPASNLLGYRAPLEGGLSGWVTLHKQPVISNRLRDDPRTNPQGIVRLANLPLRNAAVAPLMVKERAIGTLVLVDKLGGQSDFDPADLELLVSFANQAATAIENARLYEAEKRRAEQFRVIAEVGRRFALTLEITELLQQVVRLIQEAFGYYHVGIALVEGDEVVYRVGAGELWDDPQFQFRPGRLKVGAEGLTGWVAGSGQMRLVPDVSREPRYVWMEGSRTRSELVVPVIAKGRTIGVLDVQSDRLNAFDDKDVNVLQALASQAGAAIENARLYAAEQRRAEQFRVLTEVSQRITSILDIDELLRQVVRLIQRTFGYYHVEVGLIEGDELVFRIGAGDLWHDPQFRASPSRLRVGKQGVAGWAAATGQALRVPDVSREPRYIPVMGSQARSELAVPILAKGTVIGVLDIESDQLDAFDNTDLDLMASLANQTGVAIENARLYEQAPQVAVSEERSRLARDLHDSVTQSLYGITLYSQAAAGHLTAGRMDKVAEHLRELQDTSQAALAEMRLLIFELRPPILAEAGLAAALQNRLLAVEGHAGLKTEFKSELRARLPQVIEEGLYRIAQEALNNCLKHAHARRITVHVQQADGQVTLTIADDGVGFDPEAAREQGGLGLSDMQERAAQMGGRVGVNSVPGQGTRVCVEVSV